MHLCAPKKCEFGIEYVEYWCFGADVQVQFCRKFLNHDAKFAPNITQLTFIIRVELQLFRNLFYLQFSYFERYSKKNWLQLLKKILSYFVKWLEKCCLMSAMDLNRKDLFIFLFHLFMSSTKDAKNVESTWSNFTIFEKDPYQKFLVAQNGIKKHLEIYLCFLLKKVI